MTDGAKRWQPGDVILMEEFLERRKRQLINVRPQVVVHDGGYLAIASLPGSTWATRDVPGRTAMPVEDRIAMYLKEELVGEWYERTAAGRPDAAPARRLPLHPAVLGRRVALSHVVREP